MSDDSGKDTNTSTNTSTQQRVASKERLDLMWSLLCFKGNVTAYKRMLKAKAREAAVLLDGCYVFRLNQSDLNSLIQHRGLTWQMIATYVSRRKQLIVGPFFIQARFKKCQYIYVVSFHHVSFYIVEKLRHFDGSDELQTTLQTLTNLYASHHKDLCHLFTLERQTRYYRLFHEFNIRLESAAFTGGFTIDDPDFVRWVVENVVTLKIFPAKFSKQAWRVFCKVVTGATSSIKELSIAANPRQPPPLLSPALADTVRMASTIEKLSIEVSGSGEELEPFVDPSFKNDHVLHLTVYPELEKVGWLSSLLAIIKSDQFASIDYDMKIKNEAKEDNEDFYLGIDEDEDTFYSDEREQIVNSIQQATSLTNLHLPSSCTLEPEFRKEQIEPIFKERKFKKQALELAAALGSNNKCTALLARLICHNNVRLRADVLYAILRVNTTSLRALWDGGRDNRIALLEQKVENIMRELEAARALKRQKLVH